MAKQISIKQILEDLSNGKTRTEISEALELNPAEIKALWKHPKLQNKKTAKYKVDIEIQDDTIEVEMPITKNINPSVNGPIADSTGSFE